MRLTNANGGSWKSSLLSWTDGVANAGRCYHSCRNFHQGQGPGSGAGVFLRRPLPKHFVAQLLGLGAHLRQRLEAGGEELVCVRPFVLVEGAPVGDDGVVLVL